MLEYMLKILSCLFISLQLSGALVLISAMKSIDQVLKEATNSYYHIIETSNNSRKKCLTNDEKVKAALSNHYYQKFAMHYLLWGYLGAVLLNASAPNGFTDMCCVAAFSAILLFIAVFAVKRLSARHTSKYGFRWETK